MCVVGWWPWALGWREKGLGFGASGSKDSSRRAGAGRGAFCSGRREEGLLLSDVLLSSRWSALPGPWNPALSSCPKWPQVSESPGRWPVPERFLCSTAGFSGASRSRYQPGCRGPRASPSPSTPRSTRPSTRSACLRTLTAGWAGPMKSLSGTRGRASACLASCGWPSYQSPWRTCTRPTSRGSATRPCWCWWSSRPSSTAMWWSCAPWSSLATSWPPWPWLGSGWCWTSSFSCSAKRGCSPTGSLGEWCPTCCGCWYQPKSSPTWAWTSPVPTRPATRWAGKPSSSSPSSSRCRSASAPLSSSPWSPASCTHSSWGSPWPSSSRMGWRECSCWGRWVPPFDPATDFPPQGLSAEVVPVSDGGWSGSLIYVCRKDHLSLNPWLCRSTGLWLAWGIRGFPDIGHSVNPRPAWVGGRKGLGLISSEAALSLSLTPAGKDSCGERGLPWLLAS